MENLILVFHFSGPLRLGLWECGNLAAFGRDFQGARGKSGKPAFGFPQLWHFQGPPAPHFCAASVVFIPASSRPLPAVSSWPPPPDSGLALLLAAIGVYGVISYSVARRTQEIGIRMAIGAQPGEMLWMVLRDGLRLAAAGAAIGTVAALIAARYLSSLLYGITPGDPLTYAAVVLVMLAVAALACYVPARKAMRCDPMTALRNE